MRRDLASFDQAFDVLVIGAGIHGACIARLAAQSGLKVAVIDRGDFGAATSRNSAKLLHGGIRYLQHFDLRRIRESMIAQRAWFRFAPHLVRPLRIVIPTYGHGTRGPAALAMAVAAFHTIAADRNKGIHASARLPGSGLLSRRRLATDYPQISGAAATGGAYWYDGQMLDAARLTLECIWDAVEAGAVAANHFACVALLHGDKGVKGAVARDRLTGQETEIRAALTINATGPWVDRILKMGPAALVRDRVTAWTRNTNLVTRRLYDGDDAMGVTSQRASDASIGKSNRLFFTSPWHGCTVVGTTHDVHDEDPDAVEAPAASIDGFLEEINEAAPGFRLGSDDIRSVHLGLTPAEDSASERAKRALLVDHEPFNDVPGLLSVAGIKFTTAPVVAARTVNLALRKLRRAEKVRPFEVPAAGAPSRQPGHPSTNSAGSTADEDQELAWATRIYGARADQCLGELSRDGLGASEFVFRSRIRYGIQHEMVVRLSDAVLRATDWAERGLLTAAQLAWCADALGAAHGWSSEQKQREMADTRLELEKIGVRRHVSGP